MIRLVSTLAVLALLVPTTRAQQADEAAKTLAAQILDKGTQAFGDKDAKAMASNYTEDAEIVLTNQTEGETKTEVRSGRVSIEEFYKNIFNGIYNDTFPGVSSPQTQEHSRVCPAPGPGDVAHLWLLRAAHRPPIQGSVRSNPSQAG